MVRWPFVPALVLMLAACAAPVPVPSSGPLAENGSGDAHAVMPPLATIEPPPSLPADFRAPPARAGDSTLYGFSLTPALAEAMGLAARGDIEAALIRLEAAAPATPLERWFVSAWRAHQLTLAGRAPEAEAEAARTRDLEIALRGSDLVARTLRGDARARLGELPAATADYMMVADVVGNWAFPTKFSGPPENRVDFSLVTEAKTRALMGLMVRYALDGNWQEARRWGEAAERHLADIFTVMAHPLYSMGTGKPHPDLYMARAVTLSFVAAARLATGDQAGADGFARAARSYYMAIGHAPGAVYLDGLWAKALVDSGRVDEALTAGRAAAAKAEAMGLPDYVWRMQALMGESLANAGRSAEAEQALRSAQIAVDHLVGLLGSDRDKRRFGVGKEDITRRLAELDFARGDAATLLTDLDRGRARAFVDMLAGIDLVAAHPEAASLGKAGGDVARMTARTELASGGGPALAPDGIAAAVAARDAEVERLRRRSPALADAFAVAPLALAELQLALAPDQALVHWLPVAPAAPIRQLLIRRQETALVQLALTGSELDALLARFATAIKTDDTPSQRAVAAELSRRLKVDEWRANGGVYVVASGAGHRIPWGALEVSSPVSVLPTAGWLVHRPAPATAGAGVVVGDPDFAERMPQLPGARDEARAIAALLGTEPLLGPDATETGLRRRVGEGTAVLHLATHGVFNPRRPLDSAVVLAGPARLTAARLYAAPLPARLVVLSACESGIGQAGSGDDVLGLPRSLYLGGTQSILSSLWEVDDEGTRHFMTAFHRAAKAAGPGRAWLEARNTLRAEGAPPWVHGAFVLGGIITER
jgi:hypothetical protein